MVGFPPAKLLQVITKTKQGLVIVNISNVLMRIIRNYKGYS